MPLTANITKHNLLPTPWFLYCIACTHTLTHTQRRAFHFLAPCPDLPLFSDHLPDLSGGQLHSNPDLQGTNGVPRRCGDGRAGRQCQLPPAQTAATLPDRHDDVSFVNCGSGSFFTYCLWLDKLSIHRHTSFLSKTTAIFIE